MSTPELLVPDAEQLLLRARRKSRNPSALGTFDWINAIARSFREPLRTYEHGEHLTELIGRDAPYVARLS